MTNGHKILFNHMVKEKIKNKENEKQQKRLHIINCAERIFFAKGLELATMEEIAKEANLSKGTLYLYFENKENLFQEIVCRGLKYLHNKCQESIKNGENGLEKLILIGKMYHEFSLHYEDYFKIITKFQPSEKDFTEQNLYPTFQEIRKKGTQIHQLISDTIKTGIDDGSIKSSIDPLKTAIIMGAYINGLVEMVAKKEQVWKNIYQLKGEDVMDYHFKLMRTLLAP